MQTYEQLTKYYSEDVIRHNPKKVLVEYLQYEILDSIFKQKASRYLSFIGGTAIRIVYNSDRFSEDLDFDNFGLSFPEFEELTNLVIKDMKLKGFEVEFRFVEKGAYHCYIKFPKLLQEYHLDQSPTEKILVRIDTMEKEPIVEPKIETINKFSIFRDILVNPKEIILSQKLITILDRRREKGRDFYDVSFLLGITQPDFTYIKKSLNLDKDEFIKKVFKRCQLLNFNQLAQDVEPFLVDPTQSARVKNFQNFIKNTFSKL